MRVAANNILTVMLPKRKGDTSLSYFIFLLFILFVDDKGVLPLAEVIRVTYQKLFLSRSASRLLS